MYKRNRIKSSEISLNQYFDFCKNTDVSPNYHPSFVEFYFSQLKKKPKIIGRFDTHGRLIAAYPVLLGQIFPNTLHKTILREKHMKLGDIGQPEALFPVAQLIPKFSLHRFSPITSPILSEVIKSFGSYSLKSIAIGKKAKHRSAKKAQNNFFRDGGKIHSTEEIDRNDFADIYIRLHAQRWGYSIDHLRYVREQILKLYKYIDGVILIKNNDPLGALLCFQCEGESIYYVDAINMGVKSMDNKHSSYGSIMLLTSLRKAEETAYSLGKTLRYSYGYYYGEQDYKNLWANPEPTFIAF